MHERKARSEPHVKYPNDAGKADPADSGCGACASARRAGDRFCSQCGQQLTGMDPPQNVEEPPAEPGTASKPAPVQDEQNASKSDRRPPPSPRPAPPPPPQGDAEPITCDCSRELPADAKFCLECGTRVAEEPPEYFLTRLGSEPEHQPVRLTDNELVIGKAPECDLAIPNDDFVSRRHARLFCSDGEFFIEDLGSSNGTSLRVRRPLLLEPGDEILVGTQVLRLEQTGCANPEGDSGP